MLAPLTSVGRLASFSELSEFPVSCPFENQDMF
jgi:hypothetical protein